MSSAVVFPLLLFEPVAAPARPSFESASLLFFSLQQQLLLFLCRRLAQELEIILSLQKFIQSLPDLHGLLDILELVVHEGHQLVAEFFPLQVGFEVLGLFVEAVERLLSKPHLRRLHRGRDELLLSQRDHLLLVQVPGLLEGISANVGDGSRYGAGENEGVAVQLVEHLLEHGDEKRHREIYDSISHDRLPDGALHDCLLRGQ
mmetsp:Transcript_5396/g.9359  ORF Transcript_5396/g.9359 Transcript_5396/m.9359 type:complete len:203 (+) Transcript_5396:571-1179(+)